MGPFFNFNDSGFSDCEYRVALIKGSKKFLLAKTNQEKLRQLVSEIVICHYLRSMSKANLNVPSWRILVRELFRGVRKELKFNHPDRINLFEDKYYSEIKKVLSILVRSFLTKEIHNRSGISIENIVAALPAQSHAYLRSLILRSTGKINVKHCGFSLSSNNGHISTKQTCWLGTDEYSHIIVKLVLDKYPEKLIEKTAWPVFLNNSGDNKGILRTIASIGDHISIVGLNSAEVSKIVENDELYDDANPDDIVIKMAYYLMDKEILGISGYTLMEECLYV